MKEQSLEALAQRMERVERENRRLKFLGVAMLFGFPTQTLSLRPVRRGEGERLEFLGFLC